ncbi:MAG: chromosomal replication initiator protein DnaA [Planctomycetota bacterium]|nr:MAG: chromosomal replication initiator protein DnaA [Planctomycetota bacterium]
MPANTAQTWASVLQYVRAQIKPQQFDTWFPQLRCLEFDPAGHVRLATPNTFYKHWMERHYRELLTNAFEEVLGQSVAVEFVIEPPAAGNGCSASAPQTAAAPSPPAVQTPSSPASQPASNAEFGPDTAPAPASSIAGTGDIPLNPHYTFDNFVVGPSNRLAHAAALAVTENPATQYNPLFLHGGVGLGKTHLLQAICHQLIAKNRSVRYVYLSCEAFVNEYIASLQRGEVDGFRQRYRHVDMLLIDDVHFLASKKALQEEFFHTFNALYNAQRQIILSSDSPPNEIQDLEERLVSRFRWGLVAEVEPPHYETKVAIIRRKAQARGKELPDDVVDFLATNLDSNIRELEGAVLKIIVLAGLQNRPIDLALCRSALKELTSRSGHVNISQIMNVVANHFHLKIADLQSRKRSKSLVLPRHICMYLARTLTPMSLEEVGGHFGGRDHTTVLHAESKIRELREQDPELRAQLDRLARELQRG